MLASDHSQPTAKHKGGAMSLICVETGRDILFGEELMAGSRSDVKLFCALCSDVISKIVESEKRLTKCRPEEGGVDIYEGTSTCNFNGSYTWSGFEIGNFLFSISQKTAERCMPKHIAMYPRPTMLSA